jgi:hypothetical protein
MPGSKLELTAEQIRELLTELGRRLEAEGVEADLYIVGGAAIALEFGGRRVTGDVDAIFHPPADVRRLADAIAKERGLPKGWLSSSATAFLPGGPDPGSVPLSVPGLSVALASPEHLLAMKMASYRPGTDQTDLELLFETLSITSAAEAADLALQIYGDYTVVLPDREQLLLSAQAILDRLAKRRKPRQSP